MTADEENEAISSTISQNEGNDLPGEIQKNVNYLYLNQ